MFSRHKLRLTIIFFCGIIYSVKGGVMMKRGIKTYLTLFLSTLQISAFTFGGGFVIIPMLKRKFVDKLGLIDDDEMLDLVAIAQSTPGAIAVNASVLIGYRVAGILGALITALGAVTPPLVILAVISMFYTVFRENTIVGYVLKGMQAGVCAVIIDVVITMAQNIIKDRRVLPVCIMIASFIAAFVFNVNVIYIIIICAVIGVVFMRPERGKDK